MRLVAYYPTIQDEPLSNTGTVIAPPPTTATKDTGDKALETKALLPAMPAVGKVATVYTFAVKTPELVVMPFVPLITTDILDLNGS